MISNISPQYISHLLTNALIQSKLTMAAQPRVMLGADRFAAVEAKALGIVDHICPGVKVVDLATELATKLSKKGDAKDSYRQVKEQMYQLMLPAFSDKS